MVEEGTYFEPCNVPIFIVRIRGLIRRNANYLRYPHHIPHISTHLILKTKFITAKKKKIARTIMKQLPWLIPLIRHKLPPRHHTHHPARIRAKLGQCLHRVHSEIGEPRDCFLPVAVDCHAFAVDGDVSSGLRLPSAVARTRASCEGSKLHFWCLDKRRNITK